MNTIEISGNNLSSSQSNASFVLLGDTDVTQSTLLKDAINTKINSLGLKESVPGFWGTLGMEDDSKVNFTGTLTVSKYGNDNSTGETLALIQELYKINPLLNNKDSKVVEHFLNFDDIEFPDFELQVKADANGNKTDNIPRLRVTVFLAADEGALAFYQHNATDHTDTEPAALEYILPVNEEANITQRDRITYIFPILPKQRIKTDATGNPVFAEEVDKNFVIKILTFSRDNKDGNAQTIIKDVIDTVNNGDANNKYALLKFDAVGNVFKEVDYTDVKIDVSLKTLLLIHGTFSDTQSSFGGLLIQQYNGQSWLQKKIADNKYGQILAFNHPTISKNAADNVRELIIRMNGADFTGNPIDIITTSRGGLVGKYLFCFNTGNTLPLNKAALIACANGCGYFTVGNNLAKLLGILKTSADAAANPIGGIILGFAQFGVNVFLKMPGCLQMTIGDPSLNQIINTPVLPLNKTMEIQPIVGDWDKILVANDPLIKRLAERGLDVLIKLCLGNENDWVIGTPYQKIMPATNALPPIQVVGMHTQYLYTSATSGNVHDLLNTFL